MAPGHPEDTFEGREDVVLDYDGRVYCWSCYRTVLGEPEFYVTGQRLGNEPCSHCGHRGSVVLEASGAPPK